jgi:hypothetical protein
VGSRTESPIAITHEDVDTSKGTVWRGRRDQVRVAVAIQVGGRNVAGAADVPTRRPV